MDSERARSKRVRLARVHTAALCEFHGHGVVSMLISAAQPAINCWGVILCASAARFNC